MTRDLKHVIVYGAFGLLLGAKIVEVLLTRSDTSLMDWWLLLIGVVAAIVHYLPTDPERPAEKPQSADEAPEETLVLRDPAHPERSAAPTRHPAAAPAGADRERDDGFV